MDSDLQLALADYRMIFPDLASLGEGVKPATWYTEWERVKGRAFSETLITSASMDGGGATGIKQFDQRTLLHALLLRRAELDPGFAIDAFQAPAVKPMRSLGIVVRL